MISNKVVTALLAAFAILIVSCAVLMGFQVLLSSLHDAAAAQVLQWVGFGCLALLVIDVLLLIGALAVRSLDQDRHRPDER
ncbi:MAG: hypothetical protein H8E66_04515 [Planctomycetes bacterium]|nr:hypothetical protein [Planctomycetota bacterium]